MSIVHALVLAGIISFFLTTFGVLYATYIYHKPPREGDTWISVVIGDAITDVGMASITALILVYSKQWDRLWWMIFIPIYCHLLTGGPMIVGQRKLKKKQIDRIEEIRNGE